MAKVEDYERAVELLDDTRESWGMLLNQLTVARRQSRELWSCVMDALDLVDEQFKVLEQRAQQLRDSLAIQPLSELDDQAT